MNDHKQMRMHGFVAGAFYGVFMTFVLIAVAILTVKINLEKTSLFQIEFDLSPTLIGGILSFMLLSSFPWTILYAVIGYTFAPKYPRCLIAIAIIWLLSSIYVTYDITLDTVESVGPAMKILESGIQELGRVLGGEAVTGAGETIVEGIVKVAKGTWCLFSFGIGWGC